MALVGGAGNSGIVSTPVGICEVDILDDFQETKFLVHIGECFALSEAFKDSGFDIGANGAEESVGILFVADVGGSGVLGEEGVVGIGVGGGEEAAEGGGGGDDFEATFGARFGEEIGGLVVGLPGTEVEDVVAVVLGESGELVLRFIHMRGSLGEGVGNLWTYPQEGNE